MYGETENVKKLFYFTRKDGVFEVSKIVLISDCGISFLPEMSLVILRAVDLKIKHGLAFWKYLDV